MENNNIPRGTIKLTLANAFEHIILALFYIIVTKTNALTQSEIGIYSILIFLVSTFSLFTMIGLPAALIKYTSEKIGKKPLCEQ